MIWTFDDTEVISSYPLKQAIEDGVLVQIFKKRWKELSGGTPIVATAHFYERVSRAGLLEIWNECTVWRENEMVVTPLEDRLFRTKMNGRWVWVIEDGAAFTLMYPEDY